MSKYKYYFDLFNVGWFFLNFFDVENELISVLGRLIHHKRVCIIYLLFFLESISIMPLLYKN